jgi:hypothetical protein
MERVPSIFVFMVMRNGQEHIMTWPNERKEQVPLMYLSHQAVLDDNMKACIAQYAKQHELYIEMREYKLVPFTEERFYPKAINNA